MLNKITEAFSQALKRSGETARSLSARSGVTEQTISYLRSRHKSGNVVTIDSLLSVMSPEDQVVFILKLMEAKMTSNLRLFVQVIQEEEHLEALQAALEQRMNKRFDVTVTPGRASNTQPHQSKVDLQHLAQGIAGGEEAAMLLEIVAAGLRHKYFSIQPPTSRWIAASHALIDITPQPTPTEGALGLRPDGSIIHADSTLTELWRLPESVLQEVRNDSHLIPYLTERVQDVAAFLAAVQSDVEHPTQAIHHLIPLNDGRILERRSTPQQVGNQTIGRLVRYRDVSDMDALAKALRDSERQFRAFFDQNAIPMNIMDLSGRYLRVNQAFCDLVGYAEFELLQMQFQELTHPEDLAQESPQFAQIQHNEVTTYSIEKRYFHRSGSEVWVSLNPCVVHDEAGGPVYIVTTIANITEQKRLAVQRSEAERELQQSEARYRAVVQDQSELICRFRPDTTILFANNAYATYQGMSRAEMLGQQWIDWLEPDEQAAARAWLHAISAEAPMRRNTEMTRIHRTVRWIQWTNRAVAFDSEGNVSEIQSVGQDITELKTTQDRLSDREQLLNAIVQSIPGAVYRIANDDRWTMLFVSAGVEAMTGYSAEEFLTQRVYSRDLIHPDDIDRVVAAGHHEGNTFALEYRLLHRDGSIRWVLDRGKGTIDEQGQIVEWSGVIVPLDNRLDDRNEKPASTGSKTRTKPRSTIESAPGLKAKDTPRRGRGRPRKDKTP